MTNASERQVEADMTASELALNNALTDADIAALLATKGYPAERLNEGLSLVQATQAKQVAKEAARGDQLAVTDAFKAAAVAARRAYTDFRETARAHFGSEAQNREAWQALGLGGLVSSDTEKFIGAGGHRGDGGGQPGAGAGQGRQSARHRRARRRLQGHENLDERLQTHRSPRFLRPPGFVGQVGVVRQQQARSGKTNRACYFGPHLLCRYILGSGGGLKTSTRYVMQDNSRDSCDALHLCRLFRVLRGLYRRCVSDRSLRLCSPRGHWTSILTNSCQLIVS
jgi:hypothetical protein